MQKFFDVSSEMVHDFVKDVAKLIVSNELQKKYNIMVGIIGCATLSEVIAKNCGIDHETWNSILERSKEIREHIVSMVDTNDFIAHVEEVLRECDKEGEQEEKEDVQDVNNLKTKARVMVGAPILGRF
jgi:hypothetical protein